MRLNIHTPPEPGGTGVVRRARFMESADFNAANRRVFEVLQRAVRNRTLPSPVLICFELDPMSSGSILSMDIKLSSDRELDAAVRARLSSVPLDLPRLEAEAAGLDLVAMHLLQHASTPYGLIAHARQAQTWLGGRSASRNLVPGIAVRFRSFDRALQSFFTSETDPSGRTVLHYVPPSFLTE